MSCLVDSLSIGIWMYCGYECIAAMSGEYEDSSRNVAKGFRIALPLIALSYVLPTLACLAAYPAALGPNGASTAAFRPTYWATARSSRRCSGTPASCCSSLSPL